MNTHVSLPVQRSGSLPLIGSTCIRPSISAAEAQLMHASAVLKNSFLFSPFTTWWQMIHAAVYTFSGNHKHSSYEEWWDMLYFLLFLSESILCLQEHREIPGLSTGLGTQSTVIRWKTIWRHWLLLRHLDALVCVISFMCWAGLDSGDFTSTSTVQETSK